MGLLTPEVILEREIEKIKDQYPHDTNKIERDARGARSDLREGFSVEVCIEALREKYPRPGPRMRRRLSGSPKRRERRR